MLLWVKPGACPVRDARKTHIHVGEDTSTLLEKRTAKVLYFDIFLMLNRTLQCPKYLCYGDSVCNDAIMMAVLSIHGNLQMETGFMVHKFTFKLHSSGCI